MVSDNKLNFLFQTFSYSCSCEQRNFEEWVDFLISHFQLSCRENNYYCRSNWSVAQILIQTLPRADQFISSSSSRYSYTSCERANSKFLIISGHFLSIYDWLVAQTTKVIGAFKLFNRKFTIILGSVWISRGTWW
jgi:hypothetical protein